MEEERTITEIGRVPFQRVWWSAIFAGTVFAFGIMLILSLFGVAVGAAVSGAGGVTSGLKVWAGIWSLVTLFFGFLAGGWMAARASGSGMDSGQLHALVMWGLGETVLLYFAVASTARVAALFAGMTGILVVPGAGATAAGATWALITAICGLIGALIGGRVGGSTEATAAPPIRRAA
jgi:hypothetical protein